MTWFEIAVLFFSGTLAGVINTVVGSGSLVTFPALLALGYPPILANVTNNVGVLPGSISGAIAYRKELKGQFKPLAILAIFSAAGGLLGALLLLQLPAEVFDGVVPALIILACVLVIIGPRLKKEIAARRAQKGVPTNKVALFLTTGLTGLYGGYFGAAQGVILLSSLSILLPGSLQRANAYKNVLAAVANFAAAIVFVAITQVAWWAAACIAAGAILGGQIGGWVGQRLPPLVLRIVIVAVGIAALTYFILK